MKKNVFLGLFVILLAFCLTVVGCDNGSTNRNRNENVDDNTQVYTVTIGTLTNGSITANPTSGVVGTEITLTVISDSGYVLKNGSLKYETTPINEITLKFNLPAKNVIVNAEFVTMFEGTWIGIGGSALLNDLQIEFIGDGFILIFGVNQDQSMWERSKGIFEFTENEIQITQIHQWVGWLGQTQWTEMPSPNTLKTDYEFTNNDTLIIDFVTEFWELGRVFE